MKGERMAKRPSFGSIVRRRLSDITNSQSQHKFNSVEDKQSPISNQSQHKFDSVEAKQPPPICNPSEDLINQLLKEKVSLMKLVEERGKLIELSNNQIRNLRINYQKLQMQNWTLAQSNSQMLAEVNLGREKMKALQHEIICKDALLKAKNLGSEGAEKNASRESLYKANYNIKAGNHRIRRRTAKSQSMGPSTSSKHEAEREKLENKRQCLRRQSAGARPKSQEQEPTENLFEIEDVKFPFTQRPENPNQEDGQTLSGSSSSSVIKEEESCHANTEPRVAQRSSLGRPLRKAAEKVQSYKEVPLNVKMRRND